MLFSLLRIPKYLIAIAASHVDVSSNHSFWGFSVGRYEELFEQTHIDVVLIGYAFGIARNSIELPVWL